MLAAIIFVFCLLKGESHNSEQLSFFHKQVFPWEFLRKDKPFAIDIKKMHSTAIACKAGCDFHILCFYFILKFGEGKSIP